MKSTTKAKQLPADLQQPLIHNFNNPTIKREDLTSMIYFLALPKMRQVWLGLPYLLQVWHILTKLAASMVNRAQLAASLAAPL